jgi:hypothetical protein
MSGGTRLVDRIADEMAEARLQRSIRFACSKCDAHRHYFDQFHVPGIAERMAAVRPVFEAARSNLQEMAKKNRIMTGNRYTGFLYKQDTFNER